MRLKNQHLFLRLNKFLFPLFYLGHQKEKFSIVNADETTRFKVRVNTSDVLVIWEIWKLKVYDHVNFPIKPDAVVVDIGAHIGTFAVRAARLAYRGRVFAYEASQANYDLLVENQRLNQLQNLRAENVAVWDRRGMVAFHLPGSNGALGSFLQESGGDGETVSAITLDDLVDQNEIDRIDYLKIDAEGAEYPILFSCSDATLGKIKYLMLEYHEFEGMQWGYKDMEQFLRAKGFNVAPADGIFPQKFLFGTGCLRAWKDN